MISAQTRSSFVASENRCTLFRISPPWAIAIARRVIVEGNRALQNVPG
ncbi:hypothetical protein BF49_4998 [Bradyrhizobium sp.]|nr:hypothetical protein BF49_4998 [Bradyrhizobium sp.]